MPHNKLQDEKLKEYVKMGIVSAQLEQDELELKRLLQIQADKCKNKLKTETKSAMKRKMKEEIQSGKRRKEFYYKKRDWKRIELETQFNSLKSQGGDRAVQKALARKRKKNLGRHGKLMSTNSA